MVAKMFSFGDQVPVADELEEMAQYLEKYAEVLRMELYHGDKTSGYMQLIRAARTMREAKKALDQVEVVTP
jgi:hypothetical protein